MYALVMYRCNLFVIYVGYCKDPKLKFVRETFWDDVFSFMPVNFITSLINELNTQS